MIARTSDIPIKYASTLYQSFPVAIIGAADDAPTEPADLEGRTIGTPGMVFLTGGIWLIWMFNREMRARHAY